MIKFELSQPYPLFDELSRYSESEQKQHSAQVDRWLGLKTQEIESTLMNEGCRLRAPDASGEKQQLWLGLEVQQLLTPYTEIRFLLNRLGLKSGEKVVDLGAAYGRMGLVMAREFPRSKFVGYEYVGERVIEARRIFKKYPQALIQMEHADLANDRFTPEEADIYFLYDFGYPKAIEKILYNLRKISFHRDFVVVARGRTCRYLIESHHEWLHDLVPDDPETKTSFYGSRVELSARIQPLKTRHSIYEERNRA